MRLNLTRLSIASLALMLILPACHRGPPVTQVASSFTLKESALSFGRVLEGTSVKKTVTIISTDRGSLELTLHVDPPFSVQPTASLSGGESQAVDVTFLPGNVPASSSLTVTFQDQQLSIPVTGIGVRPKVCVSTKPCVSSTYDFASDSCLDATLPDATACEPTSLCLENGQCHNGSCEGVPRSCDDNNVCTIDSCSPDRGCVHSDRVCPTPSQACHVATCDPTDGCGEGIAHDGTLCGSISCVVANLCVGGNCTQQIPPDGFPCAAATACRDQSTCENKQCVRPPAHELVATFSTPVNAVPTDRIPAIQAYEDQIITDSCGWPKTLFIDGGTDGGTDAGTDLDAGVLTECRLTSWTSNGFDRWSIPIEGQLQAVTSSGIWERRDGGVNRYAFFSGQQTQTYEFGGACWPQKIAIDEQQQLWALVELPDSGHQLQTWNDAGLVNHFAASGDLLALSNTETPWTFDSSQNSVTRWFSDGGNSSFNFDGGTALSSLIANSTNSIISAQNIWRTDAGSPQPFVSALPADAGEIDSSLVLSDNLAVVYFYLKNGEARMHTLNLDGGVMSDVVILPVSEVGHIQDAVLVDGYPGAAVLRVDHVHADGGTFPTVELWANGVQLESCPLPENTQFGPGLFHHGSLYSWSIGVDGGSIFNAYDLKLPMSTTGWPQRDGLGGTRSAH